MDSLYNRIKSLCDEAGIAPGKMCNDLGISRNTMTALRNGRATTMKLEKASKIADYFGVTVDYLFTGEQKEMPTALSDEHDVLDEVDIAFYGEYKELDEDEKKVMRDMVRVMRERRAKRQGR